MLASKKIDSPVGVLTLVASPIGLAAILWSTTSPGACRWIRSPRHPSTRCYARPSARLPAISPARCARSRLPLDFCGTDFQKRVWYAPLDIPFGQNRSYAEIARAIGHRVIGSKGALTGFAGCLAAKRHLLALEQR